MKLRPAKLSFKPVKTEPKTELDSGLLVKEEAATPSSSSLEQTTVKSEPSHQPTQESKELINGVCSLCDQPFYHKTDGDFADGPLTRMNRSCFYLASCEAFLLLSCIFRNDLRMKTYRLPTYLP